MAKKYLPLLVCAIFIGVPVGIFLAVLDMQFLTMLWWDIQSSSSHSVSRLTEKIITGALCSQAYSLLVVLSLLAGALTVYFSRAYARAKGYVLLAGALTGLVVTSAFYIVSASMSLLITYDGFIGDMALLCLQNLVTDVFTLLIYFVLPGLFSVPAAVAGSFFQWRILTAGESRAVKSLQSVIAMVLATVSGMVLAGLVAAVVSFLYDTTLAYAAAFMLPLVFTLPALAYTAERPFNILSVPAFFVVLALAILAILLLPVASVWLAFQTGLI